MASSFVIACPQCRKQMKVNEELIGKKIRCKDCSTVIPVKKPSEPVAAKSNKKETKPTKTKDENEKAFGARAAILADLEKDEEAGDNPYGVALEGDDTIPRCPFCAKEMPSATAIICMNCGYNTQTRMRKQVEMVHENTGGRIFMWLLPGIICLILALGALAFCIVGIINMPKWLEGSFLQTESGGWIIRPGAFSLYMTVAFIAAVILPCGRFAYKRLVKNRKPTEFKIRGED